MPTPRTVPPPGPDDFLLFVEPAIPASDWGARREWLQDGSMAREYTYLRLTPKDQAFLTRIGIRWRY